MGVGLATVAVAAILVLTLAPDSDRPLGEHFCLICGTFGGVDAVLNVLLFMPLGLGLAVAGTSPRRAILSMAVLSALIELAQLLVVPGRDATIGDLLTNSIGGALGFVLGLRFSGLIFPTPRKAATYATSWAAVWVGAQSVFSYGFAPALPRSHYYGQLARRLGHFEQFHGKVLSATVGNVRVPDTRLEDSDRVRLLLEAGAPLAAVFTPAKVSSGIAPIVRIADNAQREIALLAQTPEGFVYGVRTGADVLALRRPFFVLIPGASNRADLSAATSPISVVSQYSPPASRITIRIGAATISRDIDLSASLGWTMLLPFQWFVGGTAMEQLISAVWLASLLMPLGYWTSCASRGRKKSLPAVVAMLLALMSLGLVFIPSTFGLGVSPPGDWGSAVIGLLVGCWAASTIARWKAESSG